MSEAPPFALPRNLAESIVAHARAEAPRECCGVLAGPDGTVVAAFPLTNRAPGNELYETDAAELLELEFRTLPSRNWEIAAVYHSHPHSVAFPSATDVALAAWPDACYLICSLEHPERPVIRGFSIVDGAIRERRIETR